MVCFHVLQKNTRITSKMVKFSVLLFIIVLYYVVALPPGMFCPPGDCYSDFKIYEIGPPKTCPEGQSLLSIDDIIEMIDYVAYTLHLKENIVNSFKTKLTNISSSYLDEVKAYNEQLSDRPKHIKHILEDMENKRHEIESVVEFVTANLQDIDVYTVKFNAAAEQANKLLNKFEMYKKICQINCEDSSEDINERYDFSEYMVMPTKHCTNTACWKIKDLYNIITNKLIEFNEDITEEISDYITDIDVICRDYVTSYKNELKEAAVEEFAMIMYNILSLQDDYYHLSKFINFISESLYSDYLNETIANITQRVVALEPDVDKYGIHCMECHKDSRIKRAVRVYENSEYTEDNDINIDCLINMKIEEIRDSIRDNISDILEEFNEFISNYEWFGPYAYVQKLLPIDEVTVLIEREQEAFDALENSVPRSTLNKVMELLQKSEEILRSLQNAQQYLDRV